MKNCVYHMDQVAQAERLLGLSAQLVQAAERADLALCAQLDTTIRSACMALLMENSSSYDAGTEKLAALKAALEAVEKARSILVEKNAVGANNRKAKVVYLKTQRESIKA